jgi:hypothetical protein
MLTIKELSEYNNAQAIANKSGCFVAKKQKGLTDYEFYLYRKTQPRNILVGKRSSTEALLKLVKNATVSIPARGAL